MPRRQGQGQGRPKRRALRFRLAFCAAALCFCAGQPQDESDPNTTTSTSSFPGISWEEIQKCRAPVDKTDVIDDPTYTKILMEEITYNCSHTVSSAMQGDRFTREENALVGKLLATWEANCTGCPSTTEGTALALKERLAYLHSPLLMAVATNYDPTMFRSFLAGSTYPPVGGGGLNKTHTLEVFYRPTPQELVEEKLQNFRDKVGPSVLTIDTKAVVANFEAPTAPTTAAFFFHGTEVMNPCMWAVNLDFAQVPYEGPGCEKCLVHKGFFNAFSSVTNASHPAKNIAAVWAGMTGHGPAQVTRVLCGGHSLGAALATLCGPWAKATFPNAVVEVVLSGSPRVFSPAAAQWYNGHMGAGAVTRLVNNKDIVPSMPLQFIKMHQSNAVDHSVRYQHVGQPILIFRKGGELPGNNTAHLAERPLWYTGSLLDHNRYIIAVNQILRCNPQFPPP